MVFESNPGFIFHDSRGFEAGGADELEKVKVFITERSKSEYLQDQVHAIWYVIDLGLYVSLFYFVGGTAFRQMTVGHSRRPKSTFSPSAGPVEVNLGNILLTLFINAFTLTVPVIAVFTKFDALEMKAYQDLLDEDCPQEQARIKAVDRAVTDFKHHLDCLYKRPFPPKNHVYLRGKKSTLTEAQCIMSFQICISQMPTVKNSLSRQQL